MRHNIGVVVLAAGGSNRLGQPKQLLVWQGVTLLHRAARLASDFCNKVVVVLGAHEERMRVELKGLSIPAVPNPEWETGMGSSVRVGVAALNEAFPDLDAVIILLCDHPLLTVETIYDLAEAYQSPGIRAVICRYDAASLGPPCLFDRSLFSELLALNGAQGAKKVFGSLPTSELAEVPFPGGLQDIDTPADWQAFSRSAPA